MRSVTVLRLCAAIVILALGSAIAAGQSKHNRAETTAKPLIIEKNEGELRVRRIPADSSTVPMSMPSSEFILKVSPKNNGSQQLVLGTEEIAPRGRIRKHKHLRQDEILLIQTGTARVRVGNTEREIHAGGLVFLPRNMTIEFGKHWLRANRAHLYLLSSGVRRLHAMCVSSCRSGAHHDHQRGIATLRACWSCGIHRVAAAAE